MNKTLVLMVFMYLKLFSFGGSLVLKYKENEPLLGKGNYLTISSIAIPTYTNAVGYFSTVEIEGKPLEIRENLQNIVIKVNGDTIKKEKVNWENYIFEVSNIELDGLTINLKWDSLIKDSLSIMLLEWDLEKKDYEVRIEYHYEKDEIEVLNLKLQMPKFNPDIYLGFDYKKPILKKQEYSKKYLVVKKIFLEDYDFEITKNPYNLKGVYLKLNSAGVIKGGEYQNVVKVIPLIEKYPNIYIEETDRENIFKNSDEIHIGIELPLDLNFNSNYEITGDILEMFYGNKKKSLISKIVVVDGQKKIKKTVGINKYYTFGDWFSLNDLDEEKGYYLLKKNGDLIKKYKNLKIKILDNEYEIDSDGNSQEIELDFCKLVFKNGNPLVSIDSMKKMVQGESISYTTIANEAEIIESVELIFFKEN